MEAGGSVGEISSEQFEAAFAGLTDTMVVSMELTIKYNTKSMLLNMTNPNTHFGIDLGANLDLDVNQLDLSAYPMATLVTSSKQASVIKAYLKKGVVFYDNDTESIQKWISENK